MQGKQTVIGDLTQAEVEGLKYFVNREVGPEVGRYPEYGVEISLRNKGYIEVVPGFYWRFRPTRKGQAAVEGLA